MKILICDDRESDGQATKEAIESTELGLECTLLRREQLENWMRDLVERGQAYVNGELGKPARTASEFDESTYDIAILDNNLADLRSNGVDHTAESLASYVRAFTEIPYIVSLNKNPQSDFDLRFLVGDYQTRADLALNTKHLGIPELWTGTARSAAAKIFRPSYWPALLNAPRRRRQQEKIVQRRLDTSVLGTLGIDEEQAQDLSRHAQGALSPSADCIADLQNISFLDFLSTSPWTLPIAAEREALRLRASAAQDQPDDPCRRVVAQIVSAEVDRWLRRDVVAPQTVLVDLPHLVARMPFLLLDGSADWEYWNQALSKSEAPFGLCPQIYDKYLKPNEYKWTYWVEKPSFWWPQLNSDPELNRLYFEAQPDWAEAVFCEDVSEFVLAEPEPRPREFAAGFEGPWNHRYVAFLEDKSYTPRSQFAR